MSESLVRQLAEWLAGHPVVVASVVHTRGATPRKSGSHMLIRALDGVVDTFESIGGGEAESRVIDEAQRLLDAGLDTSTLAVDLDGGAGAAGICGGRMELTLRRWFGELDRAHAQSLAGRLDEGERVQMIRVDRCDEADAASVGPNDRLLIVGGGHCGLALFDLARHLDFDLWVFDERQAFADPSRFPDARCLSGSFASIRQALDTPRRVLAVLLSRDFHTDLASLEQFAVRPPEFIGMMGSARRIHEVQRALEQRLPAGHALNCDDIHAPIGLDIGAHTPHEIAVSVLAELIAWRQGARRDGAG